MGAGAATGIRDGVAADLARIVDIYNHYVSNTHVTFDTGPFTVGSRCGWFSEFSADGPHRLLVAERDGIVVAYASSAALKPRPAYATSVETTIYVDPACIGQKIGGQLYGALIAALEAHESLHRAYGAIALPNDASIALHERLGFAQVATFHEVGFKFGKYWDVAWYEKDLSGGCE